MHRRARRSSTRRAGCSLWLLPRSRWSAARAAAARPARPTGGGTCSARSSRSRCSCCGLLFFSVKGEPASQRQITLNLFDCIPVGRLQVDFGLLFDPLSLVFVLLITGVGLPDPRLRGRLHGATTQGRRRFFGYFNLFVAAMLLLVLGNNYVMLYVGWEGVGLASYLLISFYFNRPPAATAGKKAFIMNRVGDVGLSHRDLPDVRLLRHDVSFADVFAHFGAGGSATTGVAAAIGLLLLLGACGKSGQFPLQAWLPDAMEGPTPVSALIHAATMVTAGVYLIARSTPIFNATPGRPDRRGHRRRDHAALRLHQRLREGRHQAGAGLLDGVSQIGYMFLGVGLGRGVYALAIIHLLGARLLQGRAVPRRPARSCTG